MTEILDKFTNTQLFWLLLFFIVVLAEVVKHLLNLAFKPLTTWMKGQHKKALRDQFAMSALNGIVAWEHGPASRNTPAATITELTLDAYRYADAMMEARTDEANNAIGNLFGEEVRNG